MLHADVEGLDYPALQALQRKRLAELARRLEGQTDWIAHFASAGMRPSDLSADDGLANAPFLDKTTLHGRYPFPFLTAPMPSVRRFMATSGTTGLPVLFGMTENDYGRLLPYQMARILSAAGVRIRAMDTGYGSADRRSTSDLPRSTAPVSPLARVAANLWSNGCGITVMMSPRCRRSG